MADTTTQQTPAAPIELAPLRRLIEQFPDAALDVVEFRGETTVRVPAERVNEICRFLRDDDQAQMNYLADLTAVDWMPRSPRFDVVYYLYSLPLNHYIRLKAGVESEVRSVTDVWAGANWAERECHDMFGIRFVGHPDLRRILLPSYWDEGYPLRKDYPLKGYNQNKWDYAPTRTTQ